MKKTLFILTAFLTTGLYAQDKDTKRSQLDFGLNGGQYSSISGMYYFSSTAKPKGYAAQVGLGLGTDRYEANRVLKAAGVDTFVGLKIEKEIVPSLFFSESIFVGYESVRVSSDNYNFDKTGSGFALYGFDFGFTFKDPDSRATLTTGVGLKDCDHLSPYLKNQFDLSGLAYPQSSIYPMIKIGIVF